MTISYIGSATAEAASVALPSHQAGDLLVVTLGMLSSYAVPTIPAGWSLAYNRAFGSNRVVGVGYKTAASSGETSGTWTGANLIIASVYRDSDNVLALHCPNSTSVASTFVRYSGIGAVTALSAGIAQRMQQSAGWVIGAACIVENSAGAASAPSGMVNRANIQGASAGELTQHDTNGAVSSWSQTDIASSSTANSVSVVCEILDTGVAKSAGGGGGLLLSGMQGGIRV